MQTLETIIQIAMALIGAYAAALWFCLVVWTFRDIQKRTRDVLVQILATVLVLLFNVPGLMLYLILRPPETLSEMYERQAESRLASLPAIVTPLLVILVALAVAFVIAGLVLPMMRAIESFV